MLCLQSGELQLWGLEDANLLDSLPSPEGVTAVAVLHDGPYILIGTETGDVLVVGVVTSNSGEPAVGAVQAQALQLQPYSGST